MGSQHDVPLLGPCHAFATPEGGVQGAGSELSVSSSDPNRTHSHSAPATLSPLLRGCAGGGVGALCLIVRSQQDAIPLGPCHTVATPERGVQGVGSELTASSPDPNRTRCHSAPTTLSPRPKGCAGDGVGALCLIVPPQHDAPPPGPCHTFATPEDGCRGWGLSSLSHRPIPTGLSPTRPLPHFRHS